MDIPRRWYNIAADLPEPLPPLVDPPERDGRISLLASILPSRLIEDEYRLDRWVLIPHEVLEAYRKLGRPTPLARARGMEKQLGVDGRVRIYYKYEGVLPTGSHKLNTAIAQAYYASLDGASEVVTETGAGQWGLAVATAASLFSLKTTVFMTASSYERKAARRTLMAALGARVVPSPSRETRSGLEAIRAAGEGHPGSLGLAIAEAVEYTLADEHRRYLPGSVLEAVLMHQTVIGLEAEEQLAEEGVEPDVLVACVGGGSNFGGFTYPFLGARLRGEAYRKLRFVAAESSAAPKLTRGEYRYDGLDSSLMLPMAKMYTLGKDYVPPATHSAGLRYHGAAASLSLLKRMGYIEAVALPEDEVLAAARRFARSEGIIPAPESAHAVLAAELEARRLASRGGGVVVFNLSGHGLLDYEAMM